MWWARDPLGGRVTYKEASLNRGGARHGSHRRTLKLLVLTERSPLVELLRRDLGCLSLGRMDPWPTMQWLNLEGKATTVRKSRSRRVGEMLQQLRGRDCGGCNTNRMGSQ